MSLEIVFRFYNHNIPDSSCEQKENADFSMNDKIYQIAEKVEDAISISQQKMKDKKVQYREERKVYSRETQKGIAYITEFNKLSK